MDGNSVGIIIGSSGLIVTVGGFILGTISHRLRITENAQENQRKSHKNDLARIYDKIDLTATEQREANLKLINEHTEMRVCVAEELGKIKTNMAHLEKTVDEHIKKKG